MKRISAVMILLLFSVVVVAAPVAAAELYSFELWNFAFYSDFFPMEPPFFGMEGLLPEGSYMATFYDSSTEESFSTSLPFSVFYSPCPDDLFDLWCPVQIYMSLPMGDVLLDLTVYAIDEPSLGFVTIITISADSLGGGFLHGSDVLLTLTPYSAPPSVSPMASVFQMTYNVMQTPMTLYGFTFSWWDVFMWSALAGVAAFFLGRYFNA